MPDTITTRSPHAPHGRVIHDLVMKRALRHVKAQRRRKAEYEDECRSYAREGYRPHYCPHGRNLWVDYDVICGPCEDGLSIHEIALMTAHDEVHTFLTRLDIYERAHKAGAPSQVTSRLMTWTTDSLDWSDA